MTLTALKQGCFCRTSNEDQS